MSGVDKAGLRKGLALLCLDGGGVRGLSSLYVLKQLMETINLQNPPRPCDYFDMIGGTSTGGLIGIMLGRLQMSVDECIEAYKTISPKIFAKVHHRLNIKGRVRGRFDHMAIEEAVKELLRKGGLPEDELLQDPVPATSFFDPIEIGNEEFIDGATPANNPIMELWSEAHDVFSDSGDSGWALDENVACVVSVGTGVPAARPFGDDPLEIGAKLVKIATDTEKRAEDFARHHPRLFREGRYIRLNVNRGLEDVGLEDESKLKDIISATRCYLQSEQVRRLLVQCATRLGKRESFSANYAFARETSEGTDVRELRYNSKKLGSAFNVRPDSDLLAWFTNTKDYKKWVAAEGGCLYYPISEKTAKGFGSLLIGALPASWKQHPPFSKGSGPAVQAAYADCRRVIPRGVESVLRLLVCQTLIMFYPSQDLWGRLLGGLDINRRRRLGRDLKIATPNTLYNTLGTLLAIVRAALRTHVKLLYVISNIHLLEDDDTARLIVQLRAELERMGVHVLITGEHKLLMTKESWGANDFPKVDEDTEYQECLKSLKFEDIHTRRNQVAVAFDGTAQWIRSHPAFVEWDQGASGVLWIQGKPGSGKSVLAKSILSLNSSATDKVMASWFYSKRGGSVGMSHSSMMRSICYQLFNQSKEIFKVCTPMYRRQAFDERLFAEMMQAIVTASSLPPILCLLDGLDESAEKDDKSGRDILHLFANVTEEPGSRLKVIVLSRPYRSIEQIYGTYDILLEAENSEDIANIVDRGLASIASTLERNEPDQLSVFARKRRLQLEGASSSPEDIPNLQDAAAQQGEIDAIRSYLLTNARGVTLWVTLSIDQAVTHARRGPVTWAMLRTMLSSLPLELHEMYSAIIVDLACHCTPEHRRIGRKILAWVIMASSKRPLLVKELFDVMSIPDSWPAPAEEYPLTDFIRNNRPVLKSWSMFCRSIHDICGPLVEFVNPSQSGSFQYDRMSKVTSRSVVQLVHQTAKEFLEGGQEYIFAFNPLEALNIVDREAEVYLRLVVPLEKTIYTPVLDDISENWKSTVIDTLMYLDDKYLLPLILSHCPVSEEYISMTMLPRNSKWMLSAFYYDMSYRDIDSDGVLEETVVGWCFTVACRLGLQTAIDNILYLTSLRPGWWAIHREAVLETALQVAKADHITELVDLIRDHRDKFTQPALQQGSKFDRPDVLLRASRMSRRPRGVYSGVTDSDFRFERPRPAMPFNATRSSVKEAILRILHYLSGNMQPLGLQAGMSWNLGDPAAEFHMGGPSQAEGTIPHLSRLGLGPTESNMSSGNARVSRLRGTCME